MLDQPLSERLRAIREAQEAQEVSPVAPEPAPERDVAPTPPPTPQSRVPLGHLLVEKGLLAASDLATALDRQRDDARPLGQILLEMGAITQGDLARTLTEQHGFDFNASLRRRLAAVDDPGPEEASAAAEPELEPPNRERYVVREPGTAEPLHVAESFLDAADAAFELIEDRDPAELEIVRTGSGQTEQLWSYHRDEAESAPPAA